MSFFGRMFGSPDAITPAQVDTLLAVPATIFHPPLHFSPYVKERFKHYILKNWATRPGKKSTIQLLGELLHDCAREYLTGTVLGDRFTKGLNEDIAEKKHEMDTARDKETKEIFANLINIKLEEISKIFTEGYTQVFKDNLLFNADGTPIGVRPGHDRDHRFRRCHVVLSEDDAARREMAVRIDPEANAFRGTLKRRSSSARRSEERHRRSSSARKKRLSSERRRRAAAGGAGTGGR
jgi:hypothetical protein